MPLGLCARLACGLTSGCFGCFSGGTRRISKNFNLNPSINIFRITTHRAISSKSTYCSQTQHTNLPLLESLTKRFNHSLSEQGLHHGIKQPRNLLRLRLLPPHIPQIPRILSRNTRQRRLRLPAPHKRAQNRPRTSPIPLLPPIILQDSSLTTHSTTNSSRNQPSPPPKPPSATKSAPTSPSCSAAQTHKSPAKSAASRL